MNLAEYLKPTAVAIDSEISSKKRALEEITRLLTGHAESVAEKDVLSSLIGREKLGSTGLGLGVAIPHGRLKGLDGAVAAFIQTKQLIDYDANDGQGVDLIFGLIVPQSATSEHLEILAKIASLFQDEAKVKALREATDTETLYQLLTNSK